MPDGEWEKRQSEVVRKYARRTIQILDDTRDIESRFLVAGDPSIVKGVVKSVRAKKTGQNESRRDGSGENKQKPDSLMTVDWDGSEDSEQYSEMNDEGAARDKSAMNPDGAMKTFRQGNEAVDVSEEKSRDDRGVESPVERGHRMLEERGGVEDSTEGNENGLKSNVEAIEREVDSQETQLSLTDDLFVQRLLLADERSLIPAKPVTPPPVPVVVPAKPKFEHRPIDFRPAGGVYSESRSMVGLVMRPGIVPGGGYQSSAPQKPKFSAWNAQPQSHEQTPHQQQQVIGPGQPHIALYRQQQQQQSTATSSGKPSPGNGPGPLPSMSVGPGTSNYTTEEVERNKLLTGDDSGQAAGPSSGPLPFNGYDPLSIPAKADAPRQYHHSSLPGMDGNLTPVRLPPLAGTGIQGGVTRGNLSDSQLEHLQPLPPRSQTNRRPQL